MKNRWIVLSTILATTVTLMAASACSGARKATPEQQISSLTILPVTAMGQQHTNIAEALGLLLENAGLQEIKIGEVPFRPQPDATFDEIAASFGRFVAEHPITTEQALYSEFQGTPTEGVHAVREVLVDKTGNVLWVDVQTSKDADFKRTRPRNPMTCCVLVVERLRPMLVPASSDGAAAEGKMAQLWAKKSGAPDKAELAAMKERLAVLKAAAPEATFAVYPIRVGDATDRAAAAQLTALLNEQGLCQATVAEASPSINVKHSSNEQRMLWDLAKSFRSHVREHTQTADYTLLADMILTPKNKVWAVHFVVCNRQGEFVIVDYQNDHHADFQALTPDSLEDCNRLAAKRLAGYLQ